MTPHILPVSELERLAAEAHDEAVRATKIPRWIWVAYAAVIGLFLLAGVQL